MKTDIDHGSGSQPSGLRSSAEEYFPRFAVLFKVHFWDDFVERQFRRLCGRARFGHVYVITDETKERISDIPHEHVIRMTEYMSESEGYLAYPTGNVFWQNTDYQLYHFIDKHPNYDYVVICEYDCVVNIDIFLIVQRMADTGLAFVGEPIRTPSVDWSWTAIARPFYPDDIEISGRLLCFAAFSRSFALELQAARREHTRRVRACEIVRPSPGVIDWPNNEVFVGSEISRILAAEAPLSSFGDASHYNWAPPHLEDDLASLSHCAFAHPVLDVPRYIRSIEKLHWDLEDLFRDGSQLQHQMGQCNPVYVVSLFLRRFAETGNWAAISRLRRYAEERIDGGRVPPLFNVARGKPATQSSTSRWSRWMHVARDAVGAVNGQVTGHFGFHTDSDEVPWWCVDLEAIYPARQVCIYNRMDLPNRSRSLVVSCSTDLMHWDTLYRHERDYDFGGANGSPLNIELNNPIPLRFLRVHLSQKQLLHLDEVEIYV
jgi:F5/8 type C domain